MTIHLAHDRALSAPADRICDTEHRAEIRLLTLSAIRLIRSLARSWDLSDREERRLLGGYAHPDKWEAELAAGAPWALPCMSEIVRLEDILVIGLRGRGLFGDDPGTGAWMRQRQPDGPFRSVPPLTWMIYGGESGVRMVRDDLETRLPVADGAR